MPYDSLVTALIWVLWLAITAQCGLAVRAFLVERREGMQVSTARLSLLTAAFLVSTVLVMGVTFLPRQSVNERVRALPVAPPSVSTPELVKLEKQRAQLQANFAELREQEEKLSQQSNILANQQRALEGQIQILTGSRPNPVTVVVRSWEDVDWRTRELLVLAILAGLAVVGFVILAVGGRMQTLFPNGLSLFGEKDETGTSQQVDRLAALVSQEKYGEALDQAASIHETKLTPLERFDFLFLRGFSALQLRLSSKTDHTEEDRRKLLSAATRDLTEVLADAPRRAEARYALAYAFRMSGDDKKALEAFENCREDLKSEKDLPFDHNESVCLLRLAEQSLTEGKTDEAQGYFDRVVKLGELGSSVVQSRIRIGMNDLRSAMNRQDLTAASAVMEKLVGIPNLREAEKAQIDVLSAALNARFALRRDSAQLALEVTDQFLSTYLPSGLPPLDDATADEPFSPVLDDDLPYPREVFHGFLLIQAAALSRIESKNRSALGEQQVDRLAAPLLRSLQLVPRQRDALGALGGLYYWFRRDKRDQAREWLEAAVSMGAKGRITRAILERDRLVEMERRQALDWFRSASSRFLRDPALAAEVRHALVEELGRFQEFEPMLINLREKPEIEQEEPTMQGLRERAAYLADLLLRMSRRGQSDQASRLAKIHGEYSACLSNLEQTAQTMSGLERRVFAELAENLVMS